MPFGDVQSVLFPASAQASSIGHLSLFMGGRGSACHTVRGTDAQGQIASDFTPVATRGTRVPGTLPNAPKHLTAWGRDPQVGKPGNQMPPNAVGPDQMAAYLNYVGTLR